MVPPPLAEVPWVELCTYEQSILHTHGFNLRGDEAPGWHLPTPDELKECGVDGKCIEAGDADEGAVEGALPHLQGVETCPAHRVSTCQGHRRLLCCL